MGERVADRAAYEKKVQQHRDEIAKESDLLFDKYDTAQRGFLEENQLHQLLTEATEGKGPNPGELQEVLGFYGANVFNEQGQVSKMQLRKALLEWRYHVIRRDDPGTGCGAGCQIQ